MRWLIVILMIFLCGSCSLLESKDSSRKSPRYLSKSHIRYDLEDKSGKFVLYREKGFQRAKNRFIVKEKVYPLNEDKTKLLEESITISNVGKMRGKLPVMRPYASRYQVWFEGKLFKTETKIDLENKILEVKMTSPEKQWNGTKKIPFPKGTGVYCYYSQLIECVGISSFVSKAISNGGGVMNFHIILEGYPYIQEQYDYIPEGIFVKARLEYDGSNRKSERRFTLKVGQQAIFYFVDKNEQFLKKFWVTQGLSQSPSEIQPKGK